jgi:hypothetical protein
MDYDQMKALASESNLTNLVMDTLQNVLEDKRVLSLYGRKVNQRTILKQVASLKT